MILRSFGEDGRMKLFLMRHGDAENGYFDSTRALSPAGIREARFAGEFLKRSREIPGVVYHSPLLRAVQTAEEVSNILGIDRNRYECKGLLPEDSVHSFAAEFIGELGEDVLLVGHQPFVASLASLLLTDSPAALTLRFTTGAVACLARSEARERWTLRFHVTAKLIARILAP